MSEALEVEEARRKLLMAAYKYAEHLSLSTGDAADYDLHEAAKQYYHACRREFTKIKFGIDT